jgi:hypothetical protein
VGTVPSVSWEEYIPKLGNPAIASFANEQVGLGCEQNLKWKYLYFRIGNKRRFQVEIHIPHATVWQWARFPGDISYWQQRLSDKRVEEKGRGAQLRFFLRTNEDCSALLAAIEELGDTPWGSNANAQGATA